MVYVSGDLATLKSKDPDLTGSYGLTHLDVGLRYSFANRSRVVPYLNGSLTGRAYRATVRVVDTFGHVVSGDAMADGLGASYGGGLEVFFVRHLSLDLGVKQSLGTFSHYSFDGTTVPDYQDLRSTTTRIQFGINYRLGSSTD